VPVPFKGDYVNLTQNPKWQKLYKQSEDSLVVFADNVMKINRADGKVSAVYGVTHTSLSS
jgi:hypothetical protein